jgi:hypothetical protein
MRLLFLLAIATGLLAQNSGQPAEKPKDLCGGQTANGAPALPARILPGQGSEYIQFPITTKSADAQRFFNQGVAQLHSFWAVEAERSFLQAAALDPEAPMPWWGIAMVAAGDYRPRFQLDTANRVFGANRDPRVVKNRAAAAAEKARALAEAPGNATDLEKLYIASIYARRFPKPAQDPDDAYIAGLQALLQKYPQEVEAKTFLALHTMRGYTLPAKTPVGTTMESVALLRQLLTDAPNHPGVHHYVIHGFEGSTFAKDAWPSCQRYAELAPKIPHALHMPGHIYSQTGRWDDAVKSFADAAAEEIQWIKADKLYGRGHHGHNVHYLSTAYAFSGRFDDAIREAKHLLEFKETPGEAAGVDSFYNVYRQGWFAMLRAMVQAGQWDAILAGELPEYNKPREQAWRHWARGLAFSAKGQIAEAKAEAKAMDAAFKHFVAQVKRQPPAELQVARLELDGHIAAASGRQKRALNLFQKASDRERAMVYSEPPYYPRPVAVPLGEWALKWNKPLVAKKAFETALDQFPAYARAQQGLRAATAAANSDQVAGH